MLRLEINHKKFNFLNLFLSQGTQGQNAHLKRMLDNSWSFLSGCHNLWVRLLEKNYFFKVKYLTHGKVTVFKLKGKHSENVCTILFVYVFMLWIWAFSFFLINLFILYFTILYWFCDTSTCIHHGCTRVPHSEPPPHLPPYTIPLGHPSASAPSFLYPASNLDWWFISYMTLYMF